MEASAAAAAGGSPTAPPPASAAAASASGSDHSAGLCPPYPDGYRLLVWVYLFAPQLLPGEELTVWRDHLPYETPMEYLTHYATLAPGDDWPRLDLALLPPELYPEPAQLGSPVDPPPAERLGQMQLLHHEALADDPAERLAQPRFPAERLAGLPTGYAYRGTCKPVLLHMTKQSPLEVTFKAAQFLKLWRIADGWPVDRWVPCVAEAVDCEPLPQHIYAPGQLYQRSCSEEVPAGCYARLNKAPWLLRSHDVVFLLQQAKALRDQLAYQTTVLTSNEPSEIRALRRLGSGDFSLPARLDSQALATACWKIASCLPLTLDQKSLLIALDSPVARLQRLLRFMREFKSSEVIACATCDGRLSQVDAMFSPYATNALRGTHINPHGFVHEICTLRSVENVISFSEPQLRDTWFPNYAWTMLACAQCHEFLGWRYDWQAPDASQEPPQGLATFYGLRRDSFKVKPIRLKRVPIQPWLSHRPAASVTLARLSEQSGRPVGMTEPGEDMLISD